jgi:hypothetical protein
MIAGRVLWRAAPTLVVSALALLGHWRESGFRLDILIQVEQIVRVVRGLDLG